MKVVRVAIFASGTGSNALALIKKAQRLSGIEVAFVLSDQEKASVLQKAQEEGTKTFIVTRKTDRNFQEAEILELLQAYQIDWIFLAGYMRMLSPAFLKTFAKWHGDASQVVNIHPSILPNYPGVDSIRRAYQDEVFETGVTIHLVDEGMDTGRILQQESLIIDPQESLESFSQRMHQLEHRMYSSFLESLTKDRKTFYFEGKM